MPDIKHQIRVMVDARAAPMPKSKIFTTFFVDLNNTINNLMMDGVNVSRRSEIIDALEYELDYIDSDIDRIIQKAKTPEVFFINVRCAHKGAAQVVKQYFADAFDNDPGIDFEFR